jgi:signal transduction histidine kinase/streptogramin lyase
VPYAYVTCLAEGTEGTIWAGSLDAGLYYFKGEKFHSITKQAGLSGDDIRSLLADREGNLWVGTRSAGLNRLVRRKLAVSGPAQGLAHDFVRGVAETADGSLWVGTTGGGLYRGGLDAFAIFGDQQIRFYATVEAVLATRDGSLWWGGSGALFQWRDDKLAASYTRTNQPWLGDVAVTALCEDPQGGLWIGTGRGGLLHWRNGEFTPFAGQVARGAVTALAAATDGTLWIGSVAGGLSRLRDGDVENLSTTNGLANNHIRTLHLDREGTLWIGTGGAGLARWKQGRLDSFTTRQGLGDDTVSQILEDDDGHLWLGCNRGIFRFKKAELAALADGKTTFVHSRVYGTTDGMPADECASGFSPAGLKMKSGQLCFSTIKGLVVIDPRQQEIDTQPPLVLLEEVMVDRQSQRIRPRAETVDDSDSPSFAITIGPGPREIDFYYTGLNFAAPEKVQFRFRLGGWDRDWVEAGDRRVAYYQRLPPGNYVFRVQASNADGVWSEPGAALAVTVQPYLWQTHWFQAVGGLSVLGLLAGTVYLVARRSYQRRLVQLETRHAIERERLRISQDMHDDVGGILTRVSILSDVGQSATSSETTPKQFERIGSQVRAAVVALDEIVWATNPKDDNLPRFAEYVGRFADECFENTTVRCWQEMPTDLPKLPLRSDIRHNVFLAVKEALNNVLKHSGATEVWLRLRLVDAEIALEIEDNGHGFDPATVATGGNGLGNMKSRLAESGGSAELSSTPGQGVKLRFVFPLPKSV